LNKYRSTFHNEDDEFFNSPGRMEIGGNHTDHNHGRVLAGAVNFGNIAVASKNNSNIISILSIGYPQFDVDLSELKPDKKEYFLSVSIYFLRVRWNYSSIACFYWYSRAKGSPD